MPWVVTGSCSQCGDCCGPPVVVDNPCMWPGQKHCVFYSAKTDCAECQIRTGQATPTPKQLTWYRANCPGYPDLKAFAAGMVPAQCTFRVVESDDASE